MCRSCRGFGLDIIGNKEFNVGRKNPLRTNINSLDRGLQAVMVTSIIAGAGSGLELSANSARAFKHYRQGYDTKHATRAIVAKAKHLDELLAQHRVLINAHQDNSAYKATMAENAVITELRNAVLSEYSEFGTTVSAYRTYENMFYALNVATNATGVGSAYYGKRGLTEPKYNGTSAVLFIINGVLTSVVL